MSIAAGTRLGPYDILAPLGSGGFGEVHKVRDTRLDRTVATANGSSTNPKLKARTNILMGKDTSLGTNPSQTSQIFPIGADSVREEIT
jgi:hypothetical protein